MAENASQPAVRLQELVAEFRDLEPRERLELLLDFAQRMPALPERFHAQRDAGENRVHECQTRVFLFVEREPQQGVQIYGEVSEEAPTVKGFVGVLQEAFAGATPEEILATPADLLNRLGLVEALGMTRTRGLQAILQRIRRDVQQLAA